MAQRLALKTKVREIDGERIVFASDFREFVRRMDELGNIGPRGVIRVDQDEEGLFLWIPIPGGQRLPTGKKLVVKRPTKKQVAVKAQIAEHKEKVAKGIKVKGHTPGVGVTRKRKIKIVRSKK